MTIQRTIKIRKNGEGVDAAKVAENATNLLTRYGHTAEELAELASADDAKIGVLFTARRQAIEDDVIGRKGKELASTAELSGKKFAYQNAEKRIKDAAAEFGFTLTDEELTPLEEKTRLEGILKLITEKAKATAPGSTNTPDEVKAIQQKLESALGGQTSAQKAAKDWEKKYNELHASIPGIQEKLQMEFFAEQTWKGVALKKDVLDTLTISDEAFIDPSGGFLAMIINLFSTLIVWLINMLATLIPRIVGLIANTIPVIIKAISTIFDAVIKLIPVIIETLIKLIPVLVSALGSIAGALIEGVLKAVPLLLIAFIKLVPVLVKEFLKMLTNDAENRGKFISGIFEQIFKLLPEIWDVIWNALKDIGVFIWDAITSLFSDIQKLWAKFGTPIMNFLYETFSKGFDRVVKYLFSNDGAFSSAIDSTFDKILPMIIKGLEMLAPMLEKGLKLLVPMILKIIDMIVPLALKYVDFFAEKGVPLIIQAFKILLSTAFSLIKTLVGAIIPIILKLIPILLNIAWVLLKAIMNIILELAPVIFKTLIDLIGVFQSAAIDLAFGLLKFIGNLFLDFAGWVVSPFVVGAKRIWKAFSSFLDAMVKFPIKLKEALFSIIDNLLGKFKGMFGFGSSKTESAPAPATSSSQGGTKWLELKKPIWLEEFLEMKWLNDIRRMFTAIGLYFQNIKTIGYDWNKAMEEAEKMNPVKKAVGDYNVANDMIVQLHKGEMVVPRDTADLVRSGKQDFTTFNEGYKTPVETRTNHYTNSSVETDTSRIEGLLEKLIETVSKKESKIEIKNPQSSSPSPTGQGTLNLSKI